MLTAAVIGFGFIGRVHLDALRRMGNVTVAAICDPVDATGKAKAFHIPAGFTDYRELIDTVKPDVVHICTPNHTHSEISAYAAGKNIHVICEKPLSDSTADADDMVRLFQGSGLVHAVNHHNRFYPMLLQLRSLVQSGTLGDIISFTGSYQQDWMMKQTDSNWRMGGTTRAVADIGVHLLDAVEYVSGLKIARICADFSTVYPVRYRVKGAGETFSDHLSAPLVKEEVPVANEDMAAVLLRLENGASGCVFVSQMVSGKTNEMKLSVHGKQASADWNSEQLDDLRVCRRGEPDAVYHKHPAYNETPVREITAFPPGHAEGFGEAMKHAFENIYHTIENPGTEGLFATFGDGVRSVHLCQKLLESSQNQTWVNV